MVVAGVDIVVREQVEFAERVNSEKENMEGEEDKGEKVELMVMEGCWHGWLESKYPLPKLLSLSVVYRRDCASTDCYFG